MVYKTLGDNNGKHNSYK